LLDFSIERLESRQLLAGVVNMTVNGAGDLILNGDGQDNRIEITMQPMDGEFIGVVNGLDGTTIRFQGQDAFQQLFEIVPDSARGETQRDIRVSLRGGDDQLEINPWIGAVGLGLNVGRNLRVDLGTGNDQFSYQGSGGFEQDFQGVTVTAPQTIVIGDMTVFGRGGDDLVDVDLITVVERLRVNTGSSDTVSLAPGGDMVLMDDIIAGSADFIGGANNTLMELDGLVVGANLRMTGSGGTDWLSFRSAVVFGDVRVDLGSGIQDALFVGDGRLMGDLDVTGAGGSQFVHFVQATENLNVAGETDIRLGSGDDLVSVSSLGTRGFQGRFTARMGGGDDLTQIQGNTAFESSISFIMGGGDDVIRFIDNAVVPPIAFQDVLLHGGSGEDEVVNLDDLFLVGELEMISIENQV